MKVVFKVLVFGLVTAAFLALLVVGGSNAGQDGEIHIAGDYYFTHSGGFQNSITEEPGGGFVVHMKVEEFIVHGNGIYVARRPVVPEDTGRTRGDLRLSDTCEYYRIDVAEREVYGPFKLAEVKTRAEWAFLKQRRGNDDFGVTTCKLAALKE
jgi:hypothetical protein